MMKIKVLLSLFCSFSVVLLHGQQAGQDSTGLPGDQFSLQAALEMFKNAASPEAFEKAINEEGNHVNNLDLNEDGEVDYVRVTDMTEGDVHVFVLQVPVSENESQDIAVIELEKTGENSAVVQIVGDEDVYGEAVLIEPDGGETAEEGKSKSKGPDHHGYMTPARIVVNVWGWPCVRFVYGPAYRPWVSPWRWRHYPAWWRPWRPVRWHAWHPHHRHFHRSYVVVSTRRVVAAPRIYAPRRTASVTVHKRHSAAVGKYRVNRTKTTVVGPRGNKTTVTQTKVRGPKGKVRGSKTTIRKRRG